MKSVWKMRENLDEPPFEIVLKQDLTHRGRMYFRKSLEFAKT